MIIIGLYELDNITADMITNCRRDVRLKMNLSMEDCRGQCDDGASNMIGNRNGVDTQIYRTEPRAVLTYCTVTLCLRYATLSKDSKFREIP